MDSQHILECILLQRYTSKQIAQLFPDQDKSFHNFIYSHAQNASYLWSQVEYQGVISLLRSKMRTNPNFRSCCVKDIIGFKDLKIDEPVRWTFSGDASWDDTYHYLLGTTIEVTSYSRFDNACQEAVDNIIWVMQNGQLRYAVVLDDQYNILNPIVPKSSLIISGVVIPRDSNSTEVYVSTLPSDSCID